MQVLINGEERNVDGERDRSLLHVLREEIGLTAAKPGCGEGACGACTVLVDGTAIQSCVTPIGDVEGRRVITLEGLLGDPTQQALGRAFAELDVMQCGFCAPGMLVTATALLRDRPNPSDRNVLEALDGNICRCGTYPRLLRAIRRASGAVAGTVETAATGEVSVPEATNRPARARTTSRPARPWDLSAPDERDYFERLGQGLVVVLSPEEAERVDNGDGGPWSTEGGAWLHVGGDGRITAFTGKVDVGQDNRTALSILVARELGAPLDAVQLVMGDTDLCPADIGTFGSRSTVDAGSVLRATAATAREWLVAEAARRWEAEPAELEATEGQIRSRDRGRSVPFGDLVAGERLIELARGDVALTPLKGVPADDRSPSPASALAPVLAATRYASDLAVPEMLHGRALRPPTLGARLRSVDLSRAQAIPGVVAIHEDDFVGVAAADPILAGVALDAVTATWSERAQPSEAELESWLRAHPIQDEGWEGSFHAESGDPEWALATAQAVLSETYTTPYIAHVPLETRVALAEWESDGRRLTVWTGSQRPFGVREELADALAIPAEDVRVIVPPTGGAYGGKHRTEAAVEAARLARAAGRPVRVRWNRAEEFAHAYFRPAAVIDIRCGALADGTITAWEFRNTNSGAMAIHTPYDIANQRLDYQPAASPLPQGSYRALAATANTFARESAMDEMAHQFGLDPLAFRLRHLSDRRLAEVFQAAAERARWPGRGSGRGSGLGIAGGIEKGARVATCARVRVEAAGQFRLERLVTAFDCGAIVDRDNLANQIEGATVMGLGGALFEAIHFDSGRIQNGSMSAYRVPRFSDMPAIEVILIDRPEQPSAGAGETPIIAVAPAIANAIFAATGRRLRSLPLVPDGRVGSQ